MDIKSTLVGAGAVVLLGAGIFGAAAFANADDIPSGPGKAVFVEQPVEVEKAAPPVVVVPEPVVTPEPEPVVVPEPAPAPEVVVPEPVVEPEVVPAAPEPEVVVEYAGPPIPAGRGQGASTP